MKFSIIKREPSYFFENIHEDLNRFLKDTFGDIEYLEKTDMPLYKIFRPAIEVKEKKDMYNIKVELPNIKKEDIDVELMQSGLSIKAESKFEETKEEENIKTSEFRYGKFVRKIPLSSEINPNSAKCEFKDGILNIEINKKEQDKKEEIKKLKID